KVDEKGSGSTLLGFWVTPTQGTGEEDDTQWEAWAVGDSCLLWVRDNRLLAAFPVVSSRHFDRPPALLRTKGGVVPPPVVARGRCRPGDTFVLATDATAKYFLRLHEEGQPPDWNRYWGLDERDWRDEVDEARRQDRIIDDDCTILLLRITGKDVASCLD